jgi:HAD superfamily hydrolase (TIGR01549 family)
MVYCSLLASNDFLAEVKGLIFDCDGVLVDSRDANRMYYNLIREKLGMLSMTPEEEDYVHAHSVMESVARIVPVQRLAEAEEARKTIRYQDLFAYTFLEPGLVHLLTVLRDMGIKLAVNTNRTDSMELLLETFDLAHFFNPVMTSAKVSHPKPNPEGVTKILRQWGMTRSQVAYVGDTELDERTARAAGVAFWAYKSPSLLAKVHVTDFDCLRRSFQNRPRTQAA